jgi:hypothetical protein
MSETTENPRTGWLMFSAVVLMLAGVHNFVSGVGALHNSTFYGSNILYHNLTFWGWVLLIWGVLQFAGGVLLMQERVLGAYFGLAAATIGSVIWFFFLLSSPAAGVVGVTLNVLVLYGVIVSGRGGGIFD